MTRTTHTFAILPLSPQAFEEVRRKLEEAGHGDAIGDEDGRPTIDMHGLAVQEDPTGEFATERQARAKGGPVLRNTRG